MWCCFARDIVQDDIVASKRIAMAQRLPPHRRDCRGSSDFDAMLARANDAMVKTSVPSTSGPARQEMRTVCAEKVLLVMCSARFGLWTFIHLCGLYK